MFAIHEPMVDDLLPNCLAAGDAFAKKPSSSSLRFLSQVLYIDSELEASRLVFASRCQGRRTSK